jgi:hypothetical protein
MEGGILSTKENNFRTRIVYPAKLPFTIEGEIKIFHDK